MVRTAVVALFLFCMMASFANAQGKTSYNFYDNHNNYQGYYRINPYSGHVDFFNRSNSYMGRYQPNMSRDRYDVYNGRNMYQGYFQVPRQHQGYRHLNGSFYNRY